MADHTSVMYVYIWTEVTPYCYYASERHCCPEGHKPPASTPRPHPLRSFTRKKRRPALSLRTPQNALSQKPSWVGAEMSPTRPQSHSPAAQQPSSPAAQQTSGRRKNATNALSQSTKSTNEYLRSGQADHGSNSQAIEH